MSMRTIGMVLCGVMVGISMAAGAWTIAAPGTLQPPVGPVTGTSHTLTEIYDRIELLRAEFQAAGNVSDRQVFFATLGNGAATTLPGTNRAVIHSVAVHDGRIRLTDAQSQNLGYAFAQATYRGSVDNFKYDSTYQVLYDVEVQLPLTITDIDGDAQSSNFQVIYSLIP